MYGEMETRFDRQDKDIQDIKNQFKNDIQDIKNLLIKNQNNQNQNNNNNKE